MNPNPNLGTRTGKREESSKIHLLGDRTDLTSSKMDGVIIYIILIIAVVVGVG